MCRVEEPDESLAADAVIQAAEAHMTRNPLHELMPVIRDMVSNFHLETTKPQVSIISPRHCTAGSKNYQRCINVMC